jgi:hypothetical protein
MADEPPFAKPTPAQQQTGIAQASLSSLLSPMNISPLTISHNYTPSATSPSAAAFPAQQTGLNKFDASIGQGRQGLGPTGADQGVRSPPPPPIVSIPLPRE